MRYRVRVDAVDRAARDRSWAGLCAGCTYARRVESDRGSVFYLCLRSASDPAFQKYPRLPVVRCAGYVSAEAARE